MELTSQKNKSKSNLKGVFSPKSIENKKLIDLRGARKNDDKQ